MEKEKNLKVSEEIKGNLKEEKLNEDIGKDVRQLEEFRITDIVTYEINNNKLVVETVPSFRNYQNFLNKPREKVRFYNGATVIEKVQIDYELYDVPEFDLLFNQVQKIVLNGEIVENSRDNLVKFLEKKPNVYAEALNKIISNRGDMGLIK